MGIPRSVTEHSIKYSDDFSSPVFETEYGDFVGLNLKDELEFCEHVAKIVRISQGDGYDGYVPYPYEVQKRRAISIENETGELHLWWGGVTQHTPFSFDVFYLPGG